MPPEHSTQQLPEQFCVLGNTLWSAFVLLEKRKGRILRVVLHLFSTESMYKYVCNVSDPFNPFQPNIYCLLYNSNEVSLENLVPIEFFSLASLLVCLSLY